MWTDEEQNKHQSCVHVNEAQRFWTSFKNDEYSVTHGFLLPVWAAGMLCGVRKFSVTCRKKTLQMQFNFSTKPVKSFFLTEMTQIWLALKDHQFSKSEIPVVRNHYNTFWLYMSKDSHGSFSGLQPTVQQNTTLLTHWWIITAQKAFLKFPCPQLSQHFASHYSSLLCGDHQLDLHSRVLTCNMYMIT